MRVLSVAVGVALIGTTVSIYGVAKRVEALEKRPSVVYINYEVPPTDFCLERVADYHGVLGLRIDPDGSVWFKRDGKWIQNHYIPKGCEPEEEE
jgi:hypothetical protein